VYAASESRVKASAKAFIRQTGNNEDIPPNTLHSDSKVDNDWIDRCPTNTYLPQAKHTSTQCTYDTTNYHSLGLCLCGGGRVCVCVCCYNSQVQVFLDDVTKAAELIDIAKKHVKTLVTAKNVHNTHTHTHTHTHTAVAWILFCFVCVFSFFFNFFKKGFFIPLLLLSLYLSVCVCVLLCRC
jgi:hypothetical protein